MTNGIAKFLVKFRLQFFCASMVFLIAAAAGLINLKFTADYRIFFSKDDPYFSAFRQLEETYASSVSAVFIVAPSSGDIFTRESLDALLWITKAGWKVPLSQRVDSITSYQHTYSHDDELVVEDLVSSKLELTDDAIARVRQIALADSLIVNRLVSSDGKAATVVVTVTIPSDEDPTPSLHKVMEEPQGVNAIISEFKQRYPGIDIKVTGIVANNYAFEQIATRDMAQLMPVLVIVILLLIGIMTKSVGNTVVTQLIMGVAVAATMGITSHFGVAVNNISGIAPMIIMTLAIAECVHLLSYYSDRLRDGHSKEEAMIMSLDTNFIAVFLTSFTTAIGFFGMNTSDSPPYVELGNISGMGIIVAYLLCHTLLPQLAMWFSKPSKAESVARSKPFNRNAVDYVIRNYRNVFVVTTVVSIILSLFTFKNELNDDNIGYFKKGVEIRDSTDFAEQKGFPVGILEYSIESGHENGITDLAYLKQVEAFVEWLKTQPEVKNVQSFVDVLKMLNKSMNNNNDEFYRLPDSSELASQYLLLYELGLPMGMDLTNMIDTKKSSLKITAQVPMMKAKNNIALDERLRGWLRENAPNLHYTGSSPMLMFAHIGQRNIHSLISGTLMSTAIICLCMVLGLASFKIGMLAILPNIFPSAIMLGLWGIFVGEVNLGVAIVFTVTTGIIVDDTIHLFSKYAQGIRKGLSTEDAIRYSFDHTGKGVLITTVVLCSGFAMLIFSDFMVNVTLGIMVSGTIAIAVIFDMVYMPSVLMLFAREEVRQKAALSEPA